MTSRTISSLLAATLALLVSSTVARARDARPKETHATEAPAPGPVPERAGDLELALRMGAATVVICSSAQDVTTVLGTGFVATPDGLIVTADHIVLDEEAGHPHLRLGVVFEGSLEPRRVRVQRRFGIENPRRNVALLAVDDVRPGETFEFMPIGASGGPAEDVLVCGFPFGMDAGGRNPVMRRGIVASSRPGMDPAQSTMCLDMTSTSGFSGAPVVSRRSGSVLGMVWGKSDVPPEPEFTNVIVLTPTDVFRSTVVPTPAVRPYGVTPKPEPPPAPAEPAPRRRPRR